MIVNQTNASAAARGFKTIFVNFFKGVVETLFYPKICQTVTTNAGSVEYNWLAAIPGMKELKGAAEKIGLELITWVITNKKWHDTVEVDEADMETDNLGLYTQRFEMLADAGARHPDELAAQALLDGFTKPDYTGSAFFHTAKKHFPGVKGTFSNKLTAALDAASYEEAREMIKTSKIVFPDGRETKLKLGKQLTLVVGPTLETTALRILNADLIDEGGVSVSNVNKGTAKLEVWSELGDSTAWFSEFTAGESNPLSYLRGTRINSIGDSNLLDKRFESDALAKGSRLAGEAVAGTINPASRTVGNRAREAAAKPENRDLASILRKIEEHTAKFAEIAVA